MKFPDQTRRLFVLAVFWAGTVLALAGCHPHAESGVLAFFFPEEQAAAEAEPGAEATDESRDTEKKYVDEDQYYLLVSHKPYIERKCAECHEGADAFSTPIFGSDWDGIFRKGGGKPGPLTLPVKELCVRCHKDLNAEWAKEQGLYLHKTAADGDCVKCHVPHQGRHPFRLIAEPDPLCISCHNANEKPGIPKCMRELHVTGPCLSCHNAHLGTSKALLKKDYEEPQHTVPPEQDLSGEKLPTVDKTIPE